MPLAKDETTVEKPPPARYVALLKRFAVRLCVAVTLGVLLLVAVELFSYTRYRTPVREAFEPAARVDFGENETPAEREYWREFDQANKVNYHQYVLWRRAPYQGESISIDQNGVRRTLYTQCDDKTYTIWMFGDSVMWGSGTPDPETIPSLVAQDYEKAGKPVCIVNYGEKGWSNTQETIALIEQLKHTSRTPDLVLFYDGGTEAFAAYQNGQADIHSNFNLFRNFLDNWGNTQKAGFAYLQQTNTYRLLKRIATKAPFERPGQQNTRELNTDALSAAVIENYEQNMDIVNLLAAHYGFRAVHAWYPNLAVGNKILTYYEQQVLDSEYQKFPDLGLIYQAVYRRGNEIKRPNFYNLGNLVDDQKETLYRGISHMNATGDKIVADRLFAILERKEASPPGPSTASGN